MLRLVELLKSVADWHDDDTMIYVTQPWSCDADALLITPAPSTTESLKRDGISYSYFLEAFVARDFLDDYAASEEGALATERKRCERLIRYAEDDA